LLDGRIVIDRIVPSPFAAGSAAVVKAADVDCPGDSGLAVLWTPPEP